MNTVIMIMHINVMVNPVYTAKFVFNDHLSALLDIVCDSEQYESSIQFFLM